MAFQCSVVTPERQVFDGQLAQAILPAHDGLIGIMTDRAPLLVKLGVGPLRLDMAGGQKKYYFVDGGVAQMRENRLSIVTGQAIEASEIDAEAARAEYAEAAAEKPVDLPAAEARAHRMKRALAKQAMVTR